MKYLKKFFKMGLWNGPKAKIIIGLILVVSLSIIMCTITKMKKTLTLNIDGKVETFVTYKGTVNEALNEKGINLSNKDKIQPTLDSKVYNKEIINVKKAVPITITGNGENLTIETAENTVEDVLLAENSLLKENGIEYDKDNYELSKPLDSKIEENSNIQVTKVEKKDVVEKESIAFDTVVEKDSSLDKSVKKVKSEGQNGEKEITYQVTYKDGVETSREMKSTKTVLEPKNKVMVQGNGTNYVSRGNESLPGKELVCYATAYSDGQVTSSGRRPQRTEGGLSTIAVDPSVIQMGSKVYVEGYGYAIAADTGGAIKGNKVDLYFNSAKETSNWGVRKVKVTVVAKPGEW